MAVGCGVPFMLMAVTFMKRYVVFRKTGIPQTIATVAPPALPNTPPPLPGQEPEFDLRVTGFFRLDEKNAQRFLNVPAALARLDSGEVALISNIDASNKFFGVTTTERVGHWAILMPPASLQKPTFGYLYDGLAERPAFRLNYTDAVNGTRSEAILSFATEEERTTALGELNRMVGYNLATA
jgi:hypothetical protein